MILNETQLAIRDAVRLFAQERVRSLSVSFGHEGGYPPELFDELASLGLMGMTASEEVGGAAAVRTVDRTKHFLRLKKSSPGKSARVDRKI